MFKHFIILFFIVLFFSCKSNKEQAEQVSFYYWKTTYTLSNYEEQYLEKKHVKRIYIRMFDIVPTAKAPQPESVLMWEEKPDTAIQFIPTVFIRNEIFYDIDSVQISLLVSKTFSLVKQILSSQQLPFTEIQIDCDWTKNTKGNYFYFLKELKKKNLIVSNTLRLYQYKYRTESGIAPTDYVTLMCYNMGNMNSPSAENSILNIKNLREYTQQVKPYPQVINVALPIFYWTLLYDNKVLEGIFYDTPNVQNGNWKQIEKNKYQIIKPYFDEQLNRSFDLQHQIRIEKISSVDFEKAKTYIHQTINNSKYEIIYFDLDSSKIQTYLH